MKALSKYWNQLKPNQRIQKKKKKKRGLVTTDTAVSDSEETDT